MPKVIHKVAMAKHGAESARARGVSVMQSTPIGRSLYNLDETTFMRLKMRFDICYTMAKQSLPFSKYPALLELETRHGRDVGFA